MADYTDTINSAARSWNVDPTLLQALIEHESQYDPTATSKAGAYGLTQLMPATAQAMGVTDIHDPTQQIYAGAKYLSQALDATHSPAEALLYYHGGPQWAQNFGPESAAYPGAVTQRYLALKAQKPTPAPSDDPFSAALKGSEQPTDNSNVVAADPFSQALEAPPEKSTPAPASVATQEPNVVQKIGAGLLRAAHDVTDVPAEYLAKGADAIGLTGALNRMGITAPSAAETTAADQAALRQYNQQYGNSTIATGARIGGQLAATLPMFQTGGSILGAVGDVGEAAASRIAPWLGSAVGATNNLLAGTAGTGLIGRGASLAANGALQGAAAGALTAGQSDQPIPEQVGTGALTGAVAAPVMGALGAIGRGAYNFLTGAGGGASPEVAQLAQMARDTYGIPITAPQMSDNSLLHIANDQSAKLPFSGAGAVENAQQTAWQRAVARTFGENADNITPQVMNRAAKRIGGVFNDIANRTKINVDDPLLDHLSQIETEAATSPLGAGGNSAIQKQIDNILEAAKDGQIDGKAYQQITRAGAPLQRAQSAADPNVRFYAGQVRDALDDAFQRSAAPEDQAALTNARKQWRNMKTVEDLVEKSPDGNLSPTLLMGQVRSASSRFDPSTGGMAYTGGGDLGDLARIGQRFMKTPPNSGTADRWLVNGLFGAPAIGASIAVNPLAAASIPAGWAANRALRSGLQSNWYANRVINSSLNPVTNPLLPRILPYAAPTAVVTRNALTGP